MSLNSQRVPFTTPGPGLRWLVRRPALVLLIGWLYLGPLKSQALPTPVVEGLRYREIREPGPLIIQILEVDPTQVRIIAARALNSGLGRETVSSMARRKGARGAVNGGFFHMGGRYDGTSAGMLKIDGRWISTTKLPRGVIAWGGQSVPVLIDRVSMRSWISGRDTMIPLHGINRKREEDQVILYNWGFHRSTLTDPGGLEVTINHRGRVTRLSRSGDAEIPGNGQVVSFGPAFPLVDSSPLRIGDQIQVHHKLVNPSGEEVPDGWSRVDYLVGGTPVLLKDGLVIQDYSPEKVASSFVIRRHPRTAVGFRSDGWWIFLVVDGRQEKRSIGMTLAQLAERMKQLGCVEALNLDGGGSTTLYLDGEVLNSPSDFGRERPVSDAILFFPRNTQRDR